MAPSMCLLNYILLQTFLHFLFNVFYPNSVRDWISVR